MINISNVQIGFHNKFFSIESLSLQKGFLYTLIGKNGIGKSTFFKTLSEQMPTFLGQIVWDSNLPKEKRIAFVTSKFDGVEHLNTYEYIALGRAPYTNIFGKLTSEDHRFIENIISQLDISHLNKKETTLLSDGERQIASIARALAQNTELIILDEPTAFLDYYNKDKIIRLLLNIAKKRNCCIIQSSHDLDISVELADKILIINPTDLNLIQFDKNFISKEQIIQLAFPIY